MILYPAIDIRGGQAVRLMRGDYAQETVYDADPVAAAQRWVEAGAEWLHVVDLDGARAGSAANRHHIQRIASEVDVPVQTGGGLRDAYSVEAVLAAGVERVVIGTAALRNPEFLDEMIARHGERIVVGVDARGGRAAIEGWTQTSDEHAAELLSSLAKRGVRRMVFTPIEVDGTMAGPPLDQLHAVAKDLDAELIYSGGVGELAHLEALAAQAPATVTGVIVGRALYEGRFTVAEAKAALR